MTRRTRLLTLMALYAGQYLAMSPLTALPAILRAEGAPLREVGAVSLVNFMVIAKVLWAPLVDRYGRRPRGHYRTWLAVTQPSIAALLLALAAVDVTRDFALLMTMACLLGALIGTQDIATDGLAVRLIDPDDRGRANAVQVGAGFAGAAVGGAGLLAVVEDAGWSWSVIALACVCLLPMAVLPRITETMEPPSPRAPATRPGRRAVRSLVRQPGVAVWAGVLVPLVWMGIMLPQSLIPPLLVDRGWPLGRIGLLTVLLGGAAGIAGASVTGRLTARLGRGRVLLAGCGVQLAATAVLLTVAIGARGVVAAVAVAALGLARGALNTVIFTVFMDFCRPATAGTDFTLLSAWGFAVAVAAQSAGPPLAGAVGYGAAVMVAGVMTVAALVWARALHGREASVSPSGSAEHAVQDAR
ncbi:MFS transporter [Streptomyces sp. LaPpAH-108]|uniref:MFS transporter n=1 Tax=Streptomyces sp. LaPpAH-108 TaxID=1155714 RepID=UPI00036294EB|nr:MFS transporter [Streptomyces sp. LaPpAH-108]